MKGFRCGIFDITENIIPAEFWSLQSSQIKDCNFDLKFLKFRPCKVHVTKHRRNICSLGVIIRFEAINCVT